MQKIILGLLFSIEKKVEITFENAIFRKIKKKRL